MEGGRFPLRMALALWLAGVATPATTPTERMLVALGTQQPPQAPFGTEAVAGFELRPASLAETVHAVVLADFVEPAELPQMRAVLRQIFARLRQKEEFVAIVVRGGDIAPVPPARNLAAFERQFSEALAEAGRSPGAALEVAALYDLLVSLIPEGSSAWSRMLLAGRLPAPPEGVFQDYVHARLARRLGEARVWLSVWPPQPVPWLPVTEVPDVTRLFEVEWTPASVPEGFEIRSLLVGGLRRRYLATAPEFPLPTFTQLTQFMAAVERASRPEAGRAELEALRQQLGVCPGWMPAWRAGAALAEQLGDLREAAFFLEGLTRRLPEDREILRRYALALAHSAPAAGAEPVLRRAVEAFPGDAMLWELLARARIEQKDLAEAHAFARRSLDLDPNNVTLWWIAADLARDLGNSPAEREALRAALDREAGRADRRARLVTLALEAGDGQQARRALEEAEGKAPDDTAILEAYAQAWERLGEPTRALPLWLRSLDVDARFEKGHVAAARLLGAAGDWEGSLAAARRGLERLPDSVPLHLAHAQALWQLGRSQEARKVIRAASSRIPESSLARFRAEIEDLFGGPEAAAAWGRYLELLDAGGAAEEAREVAKRRAILAALRDGQLEAATRWMGMSSSDGAPRRHAPGQTVVIPGGVKLLQFLSGIGGPADPGEYLVAFSRAIAQRSEAITTQQWKRQTEPLFEHYVRLAQLRSRFQSTPEGTPIILETGSRAGTQRTRNVLDLLGYRLRVSRGRVLIEPRLDKERARQQALATALGFDERTAAATLQAGQPFTFRVRDEVAPVAVGETVWAELLKRHPNPLGFAGMLMLDPRLARVYAGLAAASPAAAAGLVRRIGMNRLISEYAGLLFLYGPALTLDQDGKCRVPGGESAEEVWEALVGVSPRDGLKFLEALIRKDDGVALAYFATLHGVTPDRQRWFLSSPRRALLFYELLKDAPEWQGGAGKGVRKSPIVELVRGLPLTEDGRVRFPGGPHVWQVARGASELDRVEGLARRAQRVQPAEEEAILARMARRRYEAASEHFSQLENFLAVAQVEQALGRELEPREALILSQQFAPYEWAFPFLTALPGLGEREFREFFAWARTVDTGDTVKANLSLGLMGNVVLLTGLLVRSGKLDPGTAASVFYELCRGLRRAEEIEVQGSAVAQTLRALAAALKASPGGLQAAVEEALFGPGTTLLGQRRRRDYRKVLDLQKAPGVDLILAAFEALESAGKGVSEAREAAAAIDKCLPTLAVIPFARAVRPPPELKKQVEIWQTRDVAEAARSLREKAARRRPNLRDLERASLEARRALTPWLELALRGLVMSFYLRPEDLPVSEDPLLLRKYQYYPGRDTANSVFPAPNLKVESAAGAVPTGSLAGIPQVAGRIAMVGAPGAGGFAEAVEAQQLGVLRNALFWRLRDEDLRAVHLSVLAGREWVVEAAYDDAEARALGQAAAGLVSPERLARLGRLLGRLQAASALPMDAHEYIQTWQAVWEALSVSDLYWLGRRRSRGSDRSVVWHALRRLPAAAHEGPVHELGILPLEHARSGVPRLLPLAPYEDYAAQLLPQRTSERLAEFTLSLACAVDQAGLEAEAVGLLAEPVARLLLPRLEMSDLADFRSAVQLWKQIQPGELMSLWEQEASKGS